MPRTTLSEGPRPQCAPTSAPTANPTIPSALAWPDWTDSVRYAITRETLRVARPAVAPVVRKGASR